MDNLPDIHNKDLKEKRQIVLHIKRGIRESIILWIHGLINKN